MTYWEKTMHRAKGFSLIELMIVLSVVAILVSIAAPSFRTAMLNSRLSSTTSTLYSALQMARSEAVTQRTTIRVCAANDANSACANSTNWSNGALIMRGATLLRVIPLANTDVTVESSGNNVDYNGDGTTTATTITVSDSRNQPRQIKINVIGQACSGSACS